MFHVVFVSSSHCGGSKQEDLDKRMALFVLVVTHIEIAKQRHFERDKMTASDSVSVFAEGTFEEQIRELLEYTARGSLDDERTTLLQSLQDVVKTENLDDDRRRTAFELVLKNTKGLGQGTDQGMCAHDRSHSRLTL